MKLASCLHGNERLWWLDFKTIATAFSGFGAGILCIVWAVAGGFALADISIAGCISRSGQVIKAL